jgi:hypothetical protein
LISLIALKVLFLVEIHYKILSTINPVDNGDKIKKVLITKCMFGKFLLINYLSFA